MLDVQEVRELRELLQDLEVQKLDQVGALELRAEFEDDLLIQPLEQIV